MSPANLTTPGEMIAAIPGILGYYPSEALVLITSVMDDEAEPSPLLGRTFCAPLDGCIVPDDVVDALHKAPLAYAVAIAREETKEVTDVLDMLYSLGVDGQPVIDACWSLQEITQGANYAINFGTEGSGPWCEGTVGDIMASPTIAPLLAAGVTPQLSREDMLSLFTKRAPILYSDITGAYARGKELMQGFVDDDTSETMLGATHAAMLLALGEDTPLIDEARPLLHDVLPEREDRVALMAMFTISRLRDMTILEAVAKPESSSRILLALARSSTGRIRANALAVWSLVALSVGLSGYAMAAVDAALKEEPEHSLATLLRKCAMACRSDAMLQSALDGAQQTWDEMRALDKSAKQRHAAAQENK